MTIMNYRISAAIFVFLILFYFVMGILLLHGCNGFFQKREAARQIQLPVIKQIAVIPVDQASSSSNQKEASCIFRDSLSRISETTPKASRELTRLLFQAVQDDQRFLIVPEGQCIGLLNSLLAEDIKSSKLHLIQSLGKELEVDAVLYTELFKFEDRIGGEYSAKKPASVAFTLQLIRVSDGATLWRNTFEETQQSLTENILKARLYKKRGLRWLTAAELADYGLNQAIDELKKLLS
jgi:hypothetical protein